MRKYKFILFILLFSTIGFSQTKSELSGMWKSYAKASGLKSNTPTITYIFLGSDGSCIWGIDSSSTDPMKNVTNGKWDLTEQNEIKFVFDNSPSEASYYKPSGGNKYKQAYTEKDGKKIPVRMLEMDFYIEKTE